MDNNVLYILILALYILSIVAIALFSKKKSNAMNSFYLADRKVGAWMSAFAYGTTYFSSVIIIGYAGKLGANFGLAAIWIGIGNAILGTLIPWLLFAKKTKVYTTKNNVETMPAFFEKRFDSKNIKLVSALIIAIFLIPYSASVYQGLGSLFSSVFSISKESVETVFVICVFALAALTALYVFFGGYFGTVLTNFVQAIIMLIGVVLMIFFVFNDATIGGFSNAIEGWVAADKSIFPSGKDATFNLIILVLLTSIGPWALPQVVHKFYAVKNDDAIKKGTIISTAFCLIVGVGAYLVGSTGMLFGDSIGFGELVNGGNFDSIVPAIIVKAFPPIVISITIVLILSASMSTLSSLALSCSISVSGDIYSGYFRKKVDSKKSNLITKIMCLIFILISALIAVFKPAGIVEMMSFSWGTIAGCFLGPFVFGVLWKKANKYGAWSSIIGSLVITLGAIIIFGLQTAISQSSLIGVICMAYSVISTFVVSLITAKKVEGKIEAENE